MPDNLTTQSAPEQVCPDCNHPAERHANSGCLVPHVNLEKRSPGGVPQMDYCPCQNGAQGLAIYFDEKQLA